VLRPFDEQAKKFDGFGPSWLAADGAPAGGAIGVAGDDAGTRKRIRENCPAAPGVYGMVDAEGKLIYVGKSKALSDRLVSYFSGGKSLDSKARRIVTYTKRMLWEPAPHEFAALLRELELIRRWLPRFNVQGRPGRVRRAYVGLGRGPAPYVYLAEKPSRRDRLLVGPLFPGRDLRHMVRQVNDCFRLRDCAERVAIHFSDQLRLFPREDAAGCLRFELGNCLGPCAGGCSSRQYAARARAARDFLRGEDRSALERLERAMRAAAAAEQYERAAILRDLWRGLTGLDEMLRRLKSVRRTYSFVYPLPSYGKGETWHLIHRGQVVAAVPAPRSRRTAAQCLRALEAVYRDGPRTLGETSPDDPDLVLLVTQWFRAHPEELERTLRPDPARQRCTGGCDGGAPLRKAAGGRRAG